MRHPGDRRSAVFACKLAAAGAALAVLALAACGGSAQPSASARKAALAAQLAASENGSQAAKNGSQAAKNAPLPKQCSGLAPSVVSSISAQVVQSALAHYLKGQD